MKAIKNLIIILWILPIITNAQRYITKTAKISFFSNAPLENIKAENNQVNAALDLSNGDITLRVLMKSFEFEKEKMQEDFNENFLFTNKYPNASFDGKITNFHDININREETVNVNVEGNLTIKGISKKIIAKGTISVKNGTLDISSKFIIILKNFNVKVPNTLIKNISENIEISVNGTLKKI
ncbi:MAG: YceI family protein [Bacteroidota bacterium]|nr:YceI family protein [Bacteroidota bacterium]